MPIAGDPRREGEPEAIGESAGVVSEPEGPLNSKWPNQAERAGFAGLVFCISPADASTARARGRSDCDRARDPPICAPTRLSACRNSRTRPAIRSSQDTATGAGAATRDGGRETPPPLGVALEMLHNLFPIASS